MKFIAIYLNDKFKVLQNKSSCLFGWSIVADCISKKHLKTEVENYVSFRGGKGSFIIYKINHFHFLKLKQSGNNLESLTLGEVDKLLSKKYNFKRELQKELREKFYKKTRGPI